MVTVPCPKRGLIHRGRVMPLIKQALYPQATTAGFATGLNHSCFSASWLERVNPNRLEAITKCIFHVFQKIKLQYRGRVIYQNKKKTRALLHALGFCFGTDVGFLSGSLENRCNLANQIYASVLTINTIGFNHKHHRFCNLGLWGRLRTQKPNHPKTEP